MLNLQQISKTDPILLPTLLKSIEDNRVFKKVDYRESFTKNINNLLSFKESRHSALLTLNIFCDHHSIVNSSLVTEKTCPELNWIEQLLRFIEQEPLYHSECFEILGKLIRITSNNPDTNKLIQSKYVQKVIDSIIGSTTAPQQSLDCLAVCFELHGGTSGIYKNKIFDYCVSFIDVPDNEIAERAALCLHLLQQSRGGSVAGGVYKKCWAEYHEKTIGSLEEVLEKIMKKTGGSAGKSEKLQLPELKLSPEPFNMYTQLFVRFHNLVTILRVSLQRPFPTAKLVQASRIFSFIEDGISMSQVLLSKKAISDSMVLSLLHGQIHSNLLDILVTLMTSLKQNIIAHSKNICDILWRCLKQTSAHEQLKFEANLKLRVATYEAFIVFMRISPNNFYIKNVMENLMREALIDVTPANKEIYLMVPQTNGGKSNKRKRINADKKFSKSRAQVMSISDEQKVCAKALECLGFLLVYHGVLMKPVLFFIMQEKITAIGFVISSKAQLEGDLYRDPHCRSRLTDLIGFLMIYPVPKMPVPINYGIALLTKMKQSDADTNVRDCAAMNLYRAETAIHNRKDVFYFPADFRELRDTLLFNKQTINKFNESTSPREEITNGKKKPIDVPEDDEVDNILISDNESEKAEVELLSVKNGELKSPQKDPVEVNEISDDDDDEPVQALVISDEEPIPQPTEVKTSPKKHPSSIERKSPSKKPKISSQKDEELLIEYMADLNDEIIL